MEPMKGFLGRHLRRKLIEHECRLGQRNAQLKRIVEWIPEVRNHLNQLLETHSSSEVTLGNLLFLFKLNLIGLLLFLMLLILLIL